MSGEKSNSTIPIIVALIALAGSVMVALINRTPHDTKKTIESEVSIPKSPSSLDINIGAPKFNDLSTFCDTLRYFIEQNSREYSWLKEGKGLKSEDMKIQFSSKIDLLGYPTIIDRDDSGYVATVDILETFDSTEAKRIHYKIKDKILVCLDDFAVKKEQYTKPQENNVTMDITSYMFKKGSSVIQVALMEGKLNTTSEYSMLFVSVYFHNRNDVLRY